MAVSMCLAAIQVGLIGVAAVWITVYPLLTVKLLYDVANITGLNVRRFYLNLLPALASSLLMAGVIYLAKRIVFEYTRLMVVVLMVEIIVGIISYLLFSRAFNKSGLAGLKDFLQSNGVSQRVLRFI